MIFKSWNRLFCLHKGFLAYLLVNMGQFSCGYHQPQQRLVEVHEDLARELGEVLHRNVQQGDALTGGEDGELGHESPDHLGLPTRHGDTAVTPATVLLRKYINFSFKILDGSTGLYVVINILQKVDDNFVFLSI